MKKLYASLSVRQRISIVAAAAVVAAALFSFTNWRKENNFRPLFTSMAAEDAGVVVQKLKQSNVEYRLSENGNTILVPAERLSELRLQMAVDGLPKTGRMGFELFDKTNFGLTDFAEHVNYRRALEGELERSMGHLAEVEQARVHLTFPKDSVFLEARQPAKASVMLQLRAGARLSPQNVRAVCHLVASAVEGLVPEAVSLLDTNGNLLNRPRQGADAAAFEASEASLEYRQKIERDLLAKIHSTLEPLLGAEGFQAAVSVECDFTTAEQSEESFDPAKSVMVTSQKMEDYLASGTTSGVPGTASNLPKPAALPAAQAAGPFARRTENVTYQTSRTVRRLQQPQGSIRRLSVGLLVDQGVRWEGAGPARRRVLLPPSPEKLKSIHDLVAGVVNFNQARGDQLVVETLPFEATLRTAPPADGPVPAAPGRPSPWPVDRKLLIPAGAGLALLVLLGIGFGLARGRRNRKTVVASSTTALPAAKTEDADAALPDGTERPALAESAMRDQAEAEILKSIRLPEVHTQKSEVLIKELRQQVAKDATGASQVMRAWLRGG